MKISYEWLNSCLIWPDGQKPLPAEELGRRLLLAGFPVESIEPAGGGDFVLDVEVTSNRPDLLGHLGMAREMAALTGARLNPPKVSVAGEAGVDLPAMTFVRLGTPDCPHYTARIIEGVKVGPSPAWLARRIEAIGLRPVNNVVDITNYVLYEYSQPLHAFDYEKLSKAVDGPACGARGIIVRKARSGEKIVSIDGHVRELDGSMMVIADSARAVAVAGVMGGLDSEVGPSTRTVLLESAYFDPMSVRATARKLGLLSDASFRFERGVDPGGIKEASNRATGLIVEVCGGRALAGFAVDPADKGSLRPEHTPTVTLRLGRLAKLLGVNVPVERARTILVSLQLQLAGEKPGELTFRVPSFRQDLRREVDLIEEVARIDGYDKIPVHDRIEVIVRPPDARQSIVRRIARTLCGLGFDETVSVTFLPADKAELFARGGPGAAPGHLEVVHSSRKQENALRRSLLPSLLAARRHNETVQVKRADLFEVASVFEPVGNELPCEPLRLGLSSDGDLRQVRGVLEELVRAINPKAALTLEPLDRPEFVPGQAASVMLDGAEIGLAGRPTPEIRAGFALHQDVTVAEIDVEPLLALAGRPRAFSPISRYPAIDRDVSILLDEAAAWQQVQETIRAASPAELEAIEFADLFHGRQLPPGKKSMTFTLRYRSGEGTLTNEQANHFVARAVEALNSKLSATLRE